MKGRTYTYEELLRDSIINKRKVNGILIGSSRRDKSLFNTEPVLKDFVKALRAQGYKLQNHEYYFTLTQGDFVVVYSRASLEFQAYFKGAGDYSWETGRESLETVEQMLQWVYDAKEEMKGYPRKVVVDNDDEDYEEE